MHAHFRKRKIKDLISEHTSGFLDTTLIVEISTGSTFKPMRLITNTFVPSTNTLLSQPILASVYADQAAPLVQMPSVPVGILDLSLSEMRRKCKSHIEDMISNPQ
jgi:hypothetical protein